MILYTVDEARAAVVASGRRLIAGCRSTDTFVVTALLWGAGDLDDSTLDAGDRRLARRHRGVLDRLVDAGYGGDIVDELDGISSMCGLGDDDELHRHAS